MASSRTKPCVLFPSGLTKGLFLRRPNRFVCYVRDLEGQDNEVKVYVPNPGRMVNILRPGAVVYYHTSTDPRRKIPHTLTLVEDEKNLVAIETLHANRLVKKALGMGFFRDLLVDDFKPEYSIGKSRIDFYATTNPPRKQLLIEVKCCTHVEEDGLAKFPDAPTTRGQRHLRELMHYQTNENWQCYVIYVLQHPGARKFHPFDEIDPDFGRIFREALQVGVKMLAYSTRVTFDEVCLHEPVPVTY